MAYPARARRLLWLLYPMLMKAEGPHNNIFCEWLTSRASQQLGAEAKS